MARGPGRSSSPPARRRSADRRGKLICRPRRVPADAGFLNALSGPLNHFGYLAVFSWSWSRTSASRYRAKPILIAAAIYAGHQQLNVVAVGLVGFIAAVIGDNIGFAIGHFGGRALALRWGKYVFLTEERLDQAENFFDRHGGKIIVAARFIEGLRQANGIIAGISGMRWLRFVIFNALGAALWVGTWVSVGYLAGNHIETIYHYITQYSLYVLIAVVALIVALIIRHVLRRRRRAARRETGAAEDLRSQDPEAMTYQEPRSTPGPGYDEARDQRSPRRRSDPGQRRGSGAARAPPDSAGPPEAARRPGTACRPRTARRSRMQDSELVAFGAASFPAAMCRTGNALEQRWVRLRGRAPSAEQAAARASGRFSRCRQTTAGCPAATRSRKRGRRESPGPFGRGIEARTGGGQDGLSLDRPAEGQGVRAHARHAAHGG